MQICPIMVIDNINMKSGVVDDDREEEFGSSSKMSLRADRVRLMTQNTTTTSKVVEHFRYGI